MPILALALIALQVFVAVHVCRTGRPVWWVFVVLLFPLIGTLIYFVAEVLPTLQSEPKVARLDRHRVKTADATRKALDLLDETARKGTVHNKLVLADKCLEHGRYAEAIRLYESAREGYFVNAADLLIGLARARFAHGDFAETRQVLRDLAAAHPNSFAQERAILGARAVAAAGDPATALAELETLLGRTDSLEARRLEARYFYAEILWKQGAKDRALAELAEVLKHGQLFRMTDDEEHWVRRAGEAQAAIS